MPPVSARRASAMASGCPAATLPPGPFSWRVMETHKAARRRRRRTSISASLPDLEGPPPRASRARAEERGRWYCLQFSLFTCQMAWAWWPRIRLGIPLYMHDKTWQSKLVFCAHCDHINHRGAHLSIHGKHAIAVRPSLSRIKGKMMIITSQKCCTLDPEHACAVIKL